MESRNIATWLQIFCPQTPHLTVGSKVKIQLLSEYGHVAYNFYWNHKCSNKVANVCPRCQQAFSKPCLVNLIFAPLLTLITKDTLLVVFISPQATPCQQAFSKPCLVNLISEDTHLVFSKSLQASRGQQAFSKHFLVNFISKGTHLVFSISRQASRCQQAF